MFHAKDLPLTIPVFPLPGAVLLPRSPMPLHIFEPRYLAMLDDILKTSHRLIGMVQPLANPLTGQELNSVGCAGRVTAFSETDDGRYMITMSGISRFRITTENSGFTAYKTCDVRWDEFTRDLGGSEKDPSLDREKFLGVLHKFFASRDLQSDWDSLENADDELLINSLSMLCPFEPEDKQALLEATTLAERRQTLSTLLEFALRSGNSGETMQ